MPRQLLTAQRMFPAALALTALLSVLPAGAFGFTKLLGEAVRLVMIPFTTPGNMIASWIRPTPMRSLPPEITLDYVQHLEEQMVRHEQLFLAEQAKVEALQRQLEQIQKIDLGQIQTAVRLVAARIGMRSAGQAFGPTTLNRGARHGITVGAVACYDAVHLLGRVGEVAPLHCTLLPLANVKTGLVDARILPKDRAQVSLEAAVKLQMSPRGDGTLAGTVDRLNPVNVGDEVVLIDSTWPGSAQGMRIGAVESVRPDDMQPLRNLIVVRPVFQIAQVNDVVLKIEEETAIAQHGGNP